jgi:hypothetical protein
VGAACSSFVNTPRSSASFAARGCFHRLLDLAYGTGVLSDSS